MPTTSFYLLPLAWDLGLEVRLIATSEELQRGG